MSDIVERLREHYARSYEETAPGEVIDRYRDERMEAADEIERLRAENAKLREALVDCAHDLECEINADFPADVRAQYPVMQDKYEREMTTVYEARKALAKASS